MRRTSVTAPGPATGPGLAGEGNQGPRPARRCRTVLKTRATGTRSLPRLLDSNQTARPPSARPPRDPGQEPVAPRGVLPIGTARLGTARLAGSPGRTGGELVDPEAPPCDHLSRAASSSSPASSPPRARGLRRWGRGGGPGRRARRPGVTVLPTPTEPGPVDVRPRTRGGTPPTTSPETAAVPATAAGVPSRSSAARVGHRRRRP